MATSKSRHNAKHDLESSAQETAEDAQQVTHDFVEYLKQYARENPGTAALWCLGIGFVLGWKMKPW
jgi:ElaB/YqjD/DUF883 family membrane-anchored ribosome-binding protein